MDRTPFREAALEIGITLSEDQLESFEVFEEALYQANQVMNLTRVPREECWLRHFVDSLLIAEFIPPGASVLDIGTGPGFPAWPLACARPDLQVTALDSNGKMLGFLQSQPLPNMEILQARAEDKPPREKFDVVTGRALAPLPIQLELSAAPCRVGGCVIPMRTPNDEPLPKSISELGLELTEVVRRRLPGTHIFRLLPRYVKVRPTATWFPRRWAEIRTGSLGVKESASNRRRPPKLKN